jgi:hypothetical protein
MDNLCAGRTQVNFPQFKNQNLEKKKSNSYFIQKNNKTNGKKLNRSNRHINQFERGIELISNLI